MMALASLSRAQSPALDTIAIAFSPALVLVAVAFLALACFGSLTAASLLIYSPSKLRQRNGKGSELVAELEQRDPQYQVVAQCYALGGLVGGFLALQAGVAPENDLWGLMAFGLVALFFCGVLPSAVAERRAEATIVAGLPLLRAGLAVLRYPVVLPVCAVTQAALRVLRVRDEPTAREDIAEEVMAAVTDSVTEDALEEEEKGWIGNILAIKDKQVGKEMTRRSSMVQLPANMPMRQAVTLALEHGFSRYPVYDGEREDVVGVLYVKDALRLLNRHDDPTAAEAPVRSMMREPLFVPESMRIVQVLRRFKADRVQMAIVLDEYGGTVGLITLEDVLEEIVGNIDDEYDTQEGGQAEEQERVVEIEKGRVIEIPAHMPVEEVNALLSTELREDDDYDTIAGCVIAHLSRIPAVGEAVQIGSVEVQVLDADDRRLRRLRLTSLQPHHAPEDG